jgi:hypothetical protein
LAANVEWWRISRELGKRLPLTVLKSDILRVQSNPALRGLVLYQDRFGSYDIASVAAKTRHFEDMSDSRVSDLRAVNRSRKFSGNAPNSLSAISGTALTGWKPTSGSFSVRSDSVHRQNVQCLAG